MKVPPQMRPRAKIENQLAGVGTWVMPCDLQAGRALRQRLRPLIPLKARQRAVDYAFRHMTTTEVHMVFLKTGTWALIAKTLSEHLIGKIEKIPK